MLALNFGEGVWLIFISFLFITYLMMLFSVVVDLFRDRELGGVPKAIWVVLLIAFPLLTMLAYLITRGAGMAQRSAGAERDAQAAVDAYIREVAGAKSPTAELATAAELLDQGKLSPEEYQALKARILA